MNPPKLLEAALALVASGFYVFPCIPGEKKPLFSGGYKLATKDSDTIRLWWTKNPTANIAAYPAASGHIVLDVDLPGGPNSLQAFDPLPPTFTVVSPSGGLHHWFRGTGKSTVSDIGPDLDTRGFGGYVLMPPSVADGKPYTRHPNCPNTIAPCPPWLLAALSSSSTKKLSSVETLDLQINIDRAEAYLAGLVRQNETAVEGHGGDAKTYRTACRLLDFGLAEETTLNLLLRCWNPWCEPPWDEDELRQKVENARAYMQNEPGARGQLPVAETFKHIAESAPKAEIRSRFAPIPLSESTRFFKEPEWLIPGLIPAGGTVQITGKPKSFKTFLALDLAMGLAAGKSGLGYPLDAAPAVYIAGENAAALAIKHTAAWRLARGVETTDLPFYIVSSMLHAGEFAETAETAAEILKLPVRPKLIVIDTATRALRGLDENSAKDMGLFSEACEYLQRETGATVLVIRHTGKDATRGSRGSNVIDGDFDTLLRVDRHDKSMLVAMTVDEQRNAAEMPEALHFSGRQCGPSLVFDPIEAAEYRKQTTTENEFSQTKIVKALRSLNAIAPHGVTTHVLATELGKSGPEDVIPKIARALNALARDALAAYVTGDGRGRLWQIPEELLVPHQS